MSFILRLLISSISVFVTAYIVPGVHVESFTTSIIVAVVLGILNVFVKPVLLILTIPITIITLGLFTLVINVGLIALAAYIIQGFEIESFLAALLFGIAMSFVNSFLNMLAK